MPFLIIQKIDSSGSVDFRESTKCKQTSGFIMVQNVLEWTETDSQTHTISSIYHIYMFDL